MRINLYVYNSAITALAKAAKQSARRRHSPQPGRGDGQLSNRAMELLDQMKGDGIRPDGFSFSSAISCSGAEGKWEEALRLVDLMKKGGPRTRPNKIAYTAAIAACGRSGEHEHALRLFREMKDKDGITADRVAYNALFSALRVGGKADIASDLWDEMCCLKTAKPSAAGGARTTPDIVTLTDVVATLKDDRNRVDEIFAEAVKRGIVLADTKVSLDSFWEVDLSSMSFPVARAACRYIVNRTNQAVNEGKQVENLCFITGVGATGGQHKQSRSKSKREYLQEVLRDDFSPPIQSSVPKLAQGTVQIDKATLQDWIQSNKAS